MATAIKKRPKAWTVDDMTVMAHFAKRELDLQAALREAIVQDGRSHYAIGKAAGVEPNVIDRFISGERDIRLATAAKIAAAVCFSLVPVPECFRPSASAE